MGLGRFSTLNAGTFEKHQILQNRTDAHLELATVRAGLVLTAVIANHHPHTQIILKRNVLLF